jgi:hypothetical protein
MPPMPGRAGCVCKGLKRRHDTNPFLCSPAAPPKAVDKAETADDDDDAKVDETMQKMMEQVQEMLDRLKKK